MVDVVVLSSKSACTRVGKPAEGQGMGANPGIPAYQRIAASCMHDLMVQALLHVGHPCGFVYTSLPLILAVGTSRPLDSFLGSGFLPDDWSRHGLLPMGSPVVVFKTVSWLLFLPGWLNCMPVCFFLWYYVCFYKFSCSAGRVQHWGVSFPGQGTWQ